jgi:hypothetical protein
MLVASSALGNKKPDMLVYGAGLLALTVVVHMTGMMVLFGWVIRSRAASAARFWTQAWLLIRVAWALIFVHVLEIGVWAMFYWRRGCMPDLESAIYFSGVTYTTVGYGDLVLPIAWRLLGPIEGLTGILMCGLSTAFFFAVVSKVWSAEKRIELR